MKTMATESTAPTILIVDDEPLNVDLLEQELAAAGYRTLSAASGEEAIAKAAKAAPDLVLLDVMMAGLDGYAVCERLKASEATRTIPVIFLTALTETFEKVRAFSAGAVDYVTKPFETEELLARVGTHIALRREIEAHRRSKSTIQYLVEEIRSDRDAMVGDSPALRRVLEQIAQVATTDSTVLIQGETGTGKELVARAIHERGARRERPLVKVNCAALPRDLVESELFGHEKGAFTGATQQRRGRFELADGGTLFLDEVGELPLEAQAKLLRVLQEREFDRVGGTRSLRTDVRVIAATNRDLNARVASGGFRADLYYRLNVFPIVVPALRERREDIPGLVRHFAAKAARKLGRTLDGISPAFLERASACDWPGNIRELENLVERAIIMSNGATLDAVELFSQASPSDKAPSVQAGDATLEEMERAHIRRVLERTRWVIEGERGAARILGLNPSTLRGRLRKLGIRKTS
jgi:DNA-binding NtrC family response regulator